MTPMGFDRESSSELNPTPPRSPPPTTRALGKMEGAAAGFKELADSYKEALKEADAIVALALFILFSRLLMNY